jgi:two-component system, OmpR family, sensor histidine kinase CpxA
MYKLRFSLFTKIMLWFFLNLLLLAAIFLILFNFRFAPQSPFFRGTAYRIETVTRLVSDETSEKSRAERDEVLRKYGELNRVEFFLFDNRGNQLGGREIVLPTEVFAEITRRDDAPPNERMNQPDRKEPPPRGAPPSIYLKTENPPLYWYGMRTMTFEGNNAEPIRTRLLAASDSFYGHGLFFDPTPWLIAAAIIVGVSMLFWFPFVRSLTRNLASITAATEQIADEKFDVRVNEKRTDEIGRLGTAINHLATRLSGFVGGQKRFLGDISHELNSPLARMQFALSILEDRVDEKNRDYVADVKEEVELMSKLVSELLEFSKAGMKTANVKLEKLKLLPLVENVVARETATESAVVVIEIPENTEVTAQSELLSRAVSNVVRNAVRYAGNAGEIKISATNGNNQVRIEIADNGAGVPVESLEKLFDPFYRVETDRARQTGGTGLGLAIVKTCVEACEGKVTAENRSPKGLAVIITLKN